VRGRWGRPPDNQTQPATKLAFAPRGAVQLPDAVATNIPELGVVARVSTSIAGATTQPAPTPAPATPSTTSEKKKGCGCASAASASDFGGLLVLALGLVGLVRRRRPALHRKRSTTKGISREHT
jgi:MYXO-CTERM domain-containing protein